MANKRVLKKQINFVCSELFAEAIAASNYSSRADVNDNLNALLKGILRIHSEYIMRVSHPEPGIKPKKYYSIMIDSLNKDVNDVLDQIGNMLS